MAQVSIRRYSMNSLSVYNFQINIYEMNSNSDSVVNDVIKDYASENAILGVFTKFGGYPNKDFTYHERFNYFYSLAEQIRRLSGHNYSSDDLMIYAMYATGISHIDCQSKENLQAIIQQLESIFDLKASGENEEYAKEVVKYKLLHLYSGQIFNGRYEDMKKLLNQLNETKEYYNSLKEKILEKIK